MTTGAAAWGSAVRVLCVRLDSIGDVLMTTPAIRALREGLAGRHITLLTSPSGAAIAQLVPEIDHVIVYEAPWMKAGEAHDASVDIAMIERLRDARFDAAVIFTVFSQSALPAALMCLLAGIPLRLAHARERPYDLLTDHVAEQEPETGIRHEVRRQLDLVATVGCRPAHERLSLAVPSIAIARAEAIVHGLGLADNHRWIVLHPGATAASRRYPPELFAITVRLLAEQGWQAVVVGAAAEAPLVTAIAEQAEVPCHTSSDPLALDELAALIARAPVFLGNNSGPAHMAAAVGTPSVVLYALTNPQHTPWEVPSRVLSHEVPCAWCYRSICPMGHHACLEQVGPDAVAAAVLDLAR